MKNITILKEYPEKEYTIINWHAKYDRIVACWRFDKENSSWDQGHYFDTVLDACLYVESL